MPHFPYASATRAKEDPILKVICIEIMPFLSSYFTAHNRKVLFSPIPYRLFPHKPGPRLIPHYFTKILEYGDPILE